MKRTTTGDRRRAFPPAWPPSAGDAAGPSENGRTDNVEDAHWPALGGNFRFIDVLASVARSQLDRPRERLDAIWDVCRHCAAHVDDGPALSLIRCDESSGEIPLHPEVMATDLDGLKDFLAERGIQARPAHPPVRSAPRFAQEGDFPNADIQAWTLFLPCGPDRRKDELLAVTDALSACSNRRRTMIDGRDRRCTGCSACRHVCPQRAMRMVHDAEGFLRPNVDREPCTDCGLCEEACPIESAVLHSAPETAWAAWSGDDAERRASSSGGIFSLLARHVLARGSPRAFPGGSALRRRAFASGVQELRPGAAPGA